MSNVSPYSGLYQGAPQFNLKPSAGVNTTGPTPPPASNPQKPEVDVADVRNNLPFSGFVQANPMERMYQWIEQDAVGKPFITGAGQDVGYVPQHSLFRGYIQESLGGTWRPGGPFSLFFCFNPTDLSLNYDMSPGADSWPPSRQSADAPIFAPAAQAKNLTLNLLFDRTYERWQGGTTGPGAYGALWDARAAERLVGIYDDRPEGPPQPYTVVEVVTVREGQSGTPVGAMAPLNFTAWINGLAINFTRFDMDMVPTRCEINIGLTVAYGPKENTNPAADSNQGGSPNFTIPANSPAIPGGFEP